MKFIKIKKILRYYLKRENLFAQQLFLDRQLKVLPGTIRKKVDKDDAWFLALIINSNNVFDLGCNIGYTSLIAAIHDNIKNILLVDPNPEALSKAAQNLIINGYGNKAKFISAFVADNDEDEIKFYTIGSGAAGSMYSSHAETAGALNSFFKVKKVTIDTLVITAGFTPDLIKIDVEGAEVLALLGAQKIASLGITKFIVEVHATVEMPMVENISLIIKWCNDSQYKPFYLSKHEEIIDPNQMAHRGKCHLLLLPKSVTYPEYLLGIEEGSELSIIG